MDRQQCRAKAVSTPKVPSYNKQASPYGLSSSSSNSSQPDSVSCIGDAHGYDSPESSLSTVTTSSSNLSVFPPEMHPNPPQGQLPAMSTFQRSSFVPNQRPFIANAGPSGIGPGGPSNYVRQSYHSSSSSIASADRSTADSICSIDVNEMIATGVSDLEILNVWLSSINLDEYYSCFAAAGYDMQTISRMTPEDLTAVGIQKPNHRKKLKQEISRLNLHDGTPDYLPDSLDDWLNIVRLSCYSRGLKAQGYDCLPRVCEISVEDLEDVGIFKLGHQKRFLIAVKKLKQAIKLNTSRQHQQQNVSAASLPPRATGMQGSPTRVSNSNYSPSHRPQQSPLHVPLSMASLSLASRRQEQHHLQLQQQQQHVPPPPATQHHQSPMRRPQDQTQLPTYCPEMIPISHDSPRAVGGLEPMPLLSANANSYLPSSFSTLPSNKHNTTNAQFHTNSLGRPGSAMKQIPVAKVPAVTRTPNEDGGSTEKKNQEESKETQKLKGSGRNAGDVLNDIGSMLADLTDELDSMLHAEQNN